MRESTQVQQTSWRAPAFHTFLGKDQRGFFLLSRYLKSDVLTAYSGKPRGERWKPRGKRQSRKNPSRFTLVYPNIQGVWTFFFFLSFLVLTSERCNAELPGKKGGCRWESSLARSRESPWKGSEAVNPECPG